MRTRNRDRLLYFAAVVMTIAGGLASRHSPDIMPTWLRKYPGDALWALMTFFGWGAFFPKAPTRRIAQLAIITCCLIEVLKLYKAPWIVAVRHSTLGHLVFGHAFSWQNFVAYAVGVLGGVVIEHLLYGYSAIASRKNGQCSRTGGP